MNCEIIETPMENYPDACVVKILGCHINCATRKEAERLVDGYAKKGKARFYGDEKRLMEAES